MEELKIVHSTQSKGLVDGAASVSSIYIMATIKDMDDQNDSKPRFRRTRGEVLINVYRFLETLPLERRAVSQN